MKRFILTIRFDDEYTRTKMEAIKTIRLHMQCGLKEAKNLIEAWTDSMPFLSDGDAWGSWFTIDLSAEYLAYFMANRFNRDDFPFVIKEIREAIEAYRL